MSNTIRLRNVRVHNLRSINLDLPKKQFIGFCGPSGSGKSSLAIDTLFAEGQRRYLDTFSMAERGLFDQPEKPEADEIESVPPTIAITRSNEVVSSRVTVGTMAELGYLLQLAMARFGKMFCPDCNIEVKSHVPETIADSLLRQCLQSSIMIGFDWDPIQSDYEGIRSLITSGFQRGIIEHEVVRLDSLTVEQVANLESGTSNERLSVLVDRLLVTSDVESRLRESVDLAFKAGRESCFVLSEAAMQGLASHRFELNRKQHHHVRFSGRPVCGNCGRESQRLSASQLSSNSPAGACVDCTGLGRQDRFQWKRLVHDENLSLSSGAIPVLLEPQLKELVEEIRSVLGTRFGQPLIQVFQSDFETIGPQLMSRFELFYTGLSSKKTMRLLDPYRALVACERCQGSRLNHDALSLQIGNRNLADLSQMPLGQLAEWMAQEAAWQEVHADSHLAEEIQSRLDYLRRVGLSYLSLAREVETLSTGERQRVSMTNALGSKLVNMLYIFDEPCAGLHPTEVPDLVNALRGLADRGNSVIAIDHEMTLIRELDHVTEFGKGAGIYGGEIIYSGVAAGLEQVPESPTGDYLSRRKSLGYDAPRHPGNGKSLRLKNASGHNLKGITVEFPLGVLCVVTGVSGSGKSSLVLDTLYPAIQNAHDSKSPKGLVFDSVAGTDGIDDVVMIDQSPVGAANRSNPATYCKAFDAIRTVFAETVDARARNIKAGRFSFNTDGGRCDACRGEGTKEIDMKFMANLRVQCKFCKGKRYKQEILNCRYRGQSITDVLEMTVREAFSFFRGQKKIQSRLKPLIDVGLDYLRLGQPASTLSSGESQRMRLAGFLATGRKARTLFLFDEPTVGLHYCDISKLLDCFDALLSEGHSIIIVEHNRMIISAADYLIDLGPAAGEQGGEIVATGSPAEVAEISESLTGQVLREMMS